MGTAEKIRSRVAALLIAAGALGAVASVGLLISSGDSAQAVGTVPSTTVLTSSINPNVYRQIVVFTAVVSGTSGTPTGTVTFTSGAQTTTKTMTAGTVSWSTIFNVGPHPVTATYNGNATYAVSNALPINQVTNTAPTATTVASNVNPSVVGATINFTGTVAATFPEIAAPSSGTIRFYDGAVQIGSKAVVAGTATITVSNLAVGSHPITAVFQGSTNYNASTSPVLIQSVIPTTTTALTSNLNPATSGAAITIDAAVTSTSGTPTGSVTFTEGATAIGTATIANGHAVLVTTLAVGTHPIVGAYSGAVGYAPSTSTALNQVVDRAPTTTVTASNANPSIIADSVTFTATVASAAGTPSGSVTFADGPTTIGTATLVNGTAALTTATLGTGTHAITATYNGDTNFTPSTSTPLSQVVKTAASTTSISSDANPSTSGDAVTITASVASTIAPTGSVTFTDGATVLGTPGLVSGQASITVSTLGVGSHPITATYNGDTNSLPSVSSTLTQVVNASGSATTINSDTNPSGLGQPVTFTASVTSTAGTPTGTVAFADNGIAFGNAPLTNGTASITVSNLTVGSHPITAAYSGDGNASPSTSSPLTQTVNPAATTTAVSTDTNPSTFGSPVTFTVTVTSSAGTPTGTVTITEGPTSLGTATLVNGQAPITIATLPGGTHAITATYNGDTNFTASTSAPLSQVVKAAASTTTISSNPNPSTSGASVTLTALVTTTAGTPTRTVTFTDGPTTIGPTVLVNGTASITVSNLTVGTHPITATYSGDTNFAASSSTPLSQVVNGTGATIYVDRNNLACNNKGTGLPNIPFCTISAAATKVLPGQTVSVAAGTYPERVLISVSGTSAAPITFTPAPGATVTVTGGMNGFSATNRSWVTVRGFTVTQTTGAGIVFTTSSNMSVDGNHVSLTGQPVNGSTATGIKFNGVTQSLIANNVTDHNSDAGIFVTASDNNIVRNNESFANARVYVRAAAGIDLRNGTGNVLYSNILHDNEDSGINVWTGLAFGSNTVYDNVASGNGDHGIDVHNAVNARVISNTVYQNYDSGIEMTTSTNSMLANNVSVNNGLTSIRTSGNIRADSASVSGGSTVNDDLIFLSSPGVMVDWGGVKYTSLASFRTATGQESRGVQADPLFRAATSADFHLLSGSPAIDSANTGALSQPPLDFEGSTRFDDPTTIDTGIGPITYADRGAFEYRP